MFRVSSLAPVPFSSTTLYIMTLIIMEQSTLLSFNESLQRAALKRTTYFNSGEKFEGKNDSVKLLSIKLQKVITNNCKF
jgi:hypothetical protein